MCRAKLNSFILTPYPFNRRGRRCLCNRPYLLSGYVNHGLIKTSKARGLNDNANASARCTYNLDDFGQIIYAETHALRRSNTRYIWHYDISNCLAFQYYRTLLYYIITVECKFPVQFQTIFLPVILCMTCINYSKHQRP